MPVEQHSIPLTSDRHGTNNAIRISLDTADVVELMDYFDVARLRFYAQFGDVCWIAIFDPWLAPGGPNLRSPTRRRDEGAPDPASGSWGTNIIASIDLRSLLFEQV